ncbi:hydroxyethylthiazole kinase [Timonella sp. A28]|uniref:hydroxyethylthiazole kinase n=1 Tax=Timonella sp. A28 TaxID=3442640 RepID=UPI003EBE3753
MTRTLLSSSVQQSEHLWLAAAQRLQQKNPLVQCLTNAVVQQFSANVLLAVGGSPAMVDICEEAGQFARVADAVLINLGTPRREQQAAIREAAHVAHETKTPWVLDPVAVGALTIRTSLAHELLAYEPTAIRGNASEIRALAGHSTGGRGTDTTDTIDDAVKSAQQLYERSGAVVAVSGPVDAIVAGDDIHYNTYGHPLLTKITGGGCALGATMAAFLGADSRSPRDAVIAATTMYTLAAQEAAARVRGPGTFHAEFIDSLAHYAEVGLAQERTA